MTASNPAVVVVAAAGIDVEAGCRCCRDGSGCKVCR